VLVGDGDGEDVTVPVGDGDGEDVTVLVGDGDGVDVTVLVGDGDGEDVTVLVGDGDGEDVVVVEEDDGLGELPGKTWAQGSDSFFPEEVYVPFTQCRASTPPVLSTWPLSG
jgi:hypothetical protein